MSIFEPTAYFLNAYAAPPLAAALLLFTLALIILIRENWSPVSLTFSLLVLSGVVWLTAYAGIFCSREKETALVWIQIENSGVALIPAFLCLFALVQVQKLYSYRILLWSAYAISYLFLILTPFTDWVVEGAYQYDWGYYTRYGPLGKWFLLFFVVIMSAVLFLFWQEYKFSQSFSRKSRYRQLFIAFFLVQFSVVDTLPAFGFKVYPFGYLFVLTFILMMTKVLWQCRLTDITPAFAASEILFTMTEGVAVLDREGIVRIVNPAYCRLVSQTEKKILGTPAWESCPKMISQAHFENFLAGKAAQGYEVLLKNSNGEPLYLNATLSAMRHMSNTPEAVMLMIRDVTKERKAQKVLEQSHAELEIKVRERTSELENANIKLKEMDEKKTRFLAMAAHELKTPLTSIHGFLSLLLGARAGPLQERQLEFLNIMRKSVDRLSRLIADLLDISKIELGQIQMDETEENLKLILEEEITALRETAAQKELSIEQDIEDNLKPVVCDRERIGEVLDNLITNAVKYTPRKGTIIIRAHNTENGVNITVEDNGIGIKPDDQKILFEPFQHLRKCGLEGETSTGLGLTLVKKIIEAHGGFIKLESEEGRGSKFSVFLPYQASYAGKSVTV